MGHQATLPGETWRVLVVDDDPVIRAAEAVALENAGYAVLLAASGAEALAVLAEQRCDLVLLDVLMPDLDGPAVVRAMHRDDGLRSIPVIYVTGVDDSEFLAASLEAGIEDYVTKPTSPRELVARVRARLRGARTRETGTTDASQRERVVAALAERSYRTVFQPVVDIVDDIVVGYEALTRFDDGTPPDVQFASAAAVGLGHELEWATAQLALDSAASLPPHAYVSINVSASFLVASTTLRDRLRRCTDRRVVLEITEHEEITDYDAVHAAVEAAGPSVVLAVDDVGSGYASLRHVVRLQPRIVKLDMEWTEGAESEDRYVGAISAMSDMAERMGAVIVAEGIETPAQLDVLRSLGLRFGQGYLLGRPAAASDLGLLQTPPPNAP